MFFVQPCNDGSNLSNKHFLHLRMQMGFGFFDEDDMNSRSLCLRPILAIKADYLQKNEDQVAHAKSVVGLRQKHTAMPLGAD